MKMFYCVRHKHKYLFFGRFLFTLFLKLYNAYISNKTCSVRINVTLTRVRVAIVAVEKQ